MRPGRTMAVPAGVRLACSVLAALLVAAIGIDRATARSGEGADAFFTTYSLTTDPIPAPKGYGLSISLRDPEGDVDPAELIVTLERTGVPRSAGSGLPGAVQTHSYRFSIADANFSIEEDLSGATFDSKSQMKTWGKASAKTSKPGTPTFRGDRCNKTRTRGVQVDVSLLFKTPADDFGRIQRRAVVGGTLTRFDVRQEKGCGGFCPDTLVASTSIGTNVNVTSDLQFSAVKSVEAFGAPGAAEVVAFTLTFYVPSETTGAAFVVHRIQDYGAAASFVMDKNLKSGKVDLSKAGPSDDGMLSGRLTFSRSGPTITDDYCGGTFKRAGGKGSAPGITGLFDAGGTKTYAGTAPDSMNASAIVP